jgi:ribonuclease J
MQVIHTSGHASVADLKKMASALAPKAIVPIHSFQGSRFPALFENVAIRQDRESWTID